MRDLVERAKELAYRAHAGQTDKAGRPYIEHVARVAAAVSDDPEAEAVAWLHDVLEDCTGFDDEFMAFPEATRDAVADLTRPPAHRESDSFYYWCIRSNPLALRVKLADIADNADEARLALLPPDVAERLQRKYAKARQALQDPGHERG